MANEMKIANINRPAGNARKIYTKVVVIVNVNITAAINKTTNNIQKMHANVIKMHINKVMIIDKGDVRSEL